MTMYCAIALALSLLASTSSAREFNGYPCTHDCSGHEAGYDWAQRKDVTDPDSCRGTSNSFIEGCRAAAEERQQEESDDGENNNERENY